MEHLQARRSGGRGRKGTESSGRTHSKGGRGKERDTAVSRDPSTDQVPKDEGPVGYRRKRRVSQGGPLVVTGPSVAEVEEEVGTDPLLFGEVVGRDPPVGDVPPQLSRSCKDESESRGPPVPSPQGGPEVTREGPRRRRLVGVGS